MNDLEYTAVTASLLLGDHIELTVVDVALSNEAGDVEYHLLRAIVAQGLKRAWPKAGIYVVGD